MAENEERFDLSEAGDLGSIARYFDPAEVVANCKATYPEFRIEAGRDDMVRQGTAYSHPDCAVSNTQDMLQAFASYSSVHRDYETAVAIRNGYDEVSKNTWDQLNADHPEWEEWGWWEEYDNIPGCVEEPDAPPVFAVVRRLRESAFGPGPYPTVIQIPSGGMVFNDPYLGCSAPFAKYMGCQIISVRYRSNLDAQYPAAINDLHAAYQWMVDNAEELNVDLDRVVIYGGSSGGLFSASLPFRLKRYDWCGAPMPRMVIVDDGMLDDRGHKRVSRSLHYQWCGLTDRAGNMLYMGDNFASPYIGPEAFANHATVEECRGLPPYTIYNGQDNPGSGYVLEFSEKLADADVQCSTLIWGGATHSRPNREDNKLILPLLNLNVREDGIYEPRTGIDGAAIVEAYCVGAVRDAFDHDMRRLQV